MRACREISIISERFYYHHATPCTDQMTQLPLMYNDDLRPPVYEYVNLTSTLETSLHV